MNNTTLLVKELRETTGASFLDCKEALVAHGGDYEQATTFLRQKNLKKAAKKADRQTSEGLIIVKANDDSVCAVELNCETDFVALTPDFKTFAHQLADLVLSNETITDAEKLAMVDSPHNPTQSIQDNVQTLIGRLGENIQVGHVARYTAAPNTIVHGYVHAGAIDGYGPDEGRLGVLVAVEFADKTAHPELVETAVSKQTSHTIAHDLALHIASAAPRYVSIADIPADVLAEKREELLAQVANMNKPETIKEQIVTGRLNKFYRQTCLLEQPFLKDDDLTVAEWLRARGDEGGTEVAVSTFTRISIDVLMK